MCCVEKRSLYNLLFIFLEREKGRQSECVIPKISLKEIVSECRGRELLREVVSLGREERRQLWM